MKWFYELIYGRFRAPWDVGPRPELVSLVESGRLEPCRAIGLGSGTASNCVYLAQHGFEVTGVDFAEAAVALGRQRAAEAGVKVNFVVDDLTNLRHVPGPFDLLVDYGTLDDLGPRQRDLYSRNILSLTHPGSRFLLYCFEWPLRLWERLLVGLMSPLVGHMALEPGEVVTRFGKDFEIEQIARHVSESGWPRGEAVYFMMRRNGTAAGSGE